MSKNPGFYTQYQGKTAFEYQVNPHLVFTVFDGDQVVFTQDLERRTHYVFEFDQRIYLGDGREITDVAIEMRIQSSLHGETAYSREARQKAEAVLLPILRKRKLLALLD